MDKLKMKTSDLTDENIGKIAELFPNVITEKEGDDGRIVRAIDFNLLRQELSKELVEDDNERYRLDWPGKKASLLKANTPINKTLRPDRELSVDFDKTENVYIEGDNFEVLKILQESYLGKIKMIYIDPPYNTGKDFVYRDNTTQSKEEYEEEIGVADEEGGKLFRNTDTNGRFHSDWLSMMYERLVVARDLLKDDGVIFMSIDDHEVHNLRKIGDEVFGEENFIENYVWESTFRPDNSSKLERENAQHVLLYSKNKNTIKQLVGIGKNTEGLPSLTKNSMKISKLKFLAGEVETYLEDGLYKKGLRDSGYELHDDVNVKNGFIVNDFSLSGRVIWGQDYLSNQLKNGTKIIIKGDTFIPYSKKMEDGVLAPTTIIPKNIVGDVLAGRAETKNLLNGSIFDYPKPISLIKYLLSYLVENDYYVLDFFAGSATTAHAVIQLNAEDGGKRKFIMAQLPEKTDEKSEAYKAGYKTISEIGMERIRRAGKKILEDNADKLKERETPLDIGFRVYKTDSTNMKDVYYNPAELKQSEMDEYISNIKEDRGSEDLLTQVMLDLGLTLDLPIEKKDIKGSTVFFIAGNSLVACFDENMNIEIIDEIAKIKPLKVVFRDACFKDDKDAINMENKFKSLSPETVISVI
jgi:adenine-specific DNA-methyltransferase